jgi:hypothetical protein
MRQTRTRKVASKGAWGSRAASVPGLNTVSLDKIGAQSVLIATAEQGDGTDQGCAGRWGPAVGLPEREPAGSRRARRGGTEVSVSGLSFNLDIRHHPRGITALRSTQHAPENSSSLPCSQPGPRSTQRVAPQAPSRHSDTSRDPHSPEDPATRAERRVALVGY